ncbi:UNVERIFIED_ORG: hypothetical protein ABIC43_000574 [Variovorax guangxiensis]
MQELEQRLSYRSAKHYVVDSKVWALCHLFSVINAAEWLLSGKLCAAIGGPLLAEAVWKRPDLRVCRTGD